MMGLLQGLNEGLKKARIERALVRHSFARFVHEDGVSSIDNTVPVFCFHAVNAPEFEAALQYLQ